MKCLGTTQSICCRDHTNIAHVSTGTGFGTYVDWDFLLICVLYPLEACKSFLMPCILFQRRKIDRANAASSHLVKEDTTDSNGMFTRHFKEIGQLLSYHIHVRN
jgi:hypothetical protein